VKTDDSVNAKSGDKLNMISNVCSFVIHVENTNEMGALTFQLMKNSATALAPLAAAITMLALF
jgi:hypothetical protein